MQCPPPVSAQVTNPGTSELHTEELIYSFWGGYSFNSVRLLGKTPNSQTTIIGLGIKKKLREYPNGNLLFYSADIVPYLQYQYPKRDYAGQRSEVNGWGFSPVGFYLLKPVTKYFSPFINASGGTIIMDHTFPTDLGKRLNFTFDITVGTQIHFSENKYFTFGYKFHHISNAQTGSENPGLDSNFLYLSLSL